MRLNVLAIAAVAAMVLSGCSAPDPSSTPGKSGLVRHITAKLDDESVRLAEMESTVEGTLGRLATVWYEYTHTGDDANPKELTFKYTLATGTPGSVPLSKFTTKTTLHEGDRVKIQPSPAASVFGTASVVDASGESLAARGGQSANWFTVGNYPIPAAASVAGKTAWEVQAKGSFEAEVRDMDLPDSTRYDCDQDGCQEVTEPSGHIDHARLKVGLSGSGTLSVDAARDALRLAADGKLRYDVDALLQAHMPDADVDGTAAGYVEAQSTGTLDLGFNAKREIKSLAYGGHVTVDGDVDVQGFPGAEVPSEHPWMEQTQPRTSVPLSLGSQAADPGLVKFLLAAYALDLAVGDEIRFEATSPADDLGRSMQVSYVSQVLGVEDRAVAGADRPTFKVSDALGFKTLQGGAVAKEQKVEITYWIDLASMLPVYAQSKIQQSFDGTDIGDFLGTLSGLEGFEMPQVPAGARVVFTTDVTEKMTAYGGDVQTAAIVGVGAARLVPLLGAMSLFN